MAMLKNGITGKTTCPSWSVDAPFWQEKNNTDTLGYNITVSVIEVADKVTMKYGKNGCEYIGYTQCLRAWSMLMIFITTISS